MRTMVRSGAVLAMVAALAISTGCSRTQRTLAGAGIGGASGAVIGNAVAGTGGAIVGGVGGAVAGGYIGRHY
ncbi:hypothetical protein LQ948_04425 [Jiella sp. MQZ9-1]|uniref:Uncharacterized protein n=1 Tax=Jiella flava TaxID=2816857 RepID=A0A939FX67_9HYPH|nr:hypothetical protein [Jiella flava]MBO0661810.1 hypothetical protein [Jiella flava]MCD2470451.1 hypothetical protein [Jiella flava]